MIAAQRVTVEPGNDVRPGPSGRLRSGTLLRDGNRVIVRLDSAFVDASSGSVAGAVGLPAGDCVEVPIEIVYEDDRLLAVNKPPRMNVYPTRRHLGGSLVELVHRRHRALALGGSPPSPCHRLDRETSGVVLFARDREARADVGRQFEERTVEKTYLAQVAGAPAQDEGVIDLPLGRDLGSRVEIKQGVRLDGGGLAARTLWKVRERSVGGAGGIIASRALIELHPETGRQHQLRAHLAAIGHPILGDLLYLGGDDLFLASLERELTAAELEAVGGVDRMALHAWRLGVRHPSTGARFTIEAPSGGPPSSWSGSISSD